MIKLWITQKNILARDDTGMNAFQQSYQHKEAYSILNQRVTFMQRIYCDSKYSKQMNEWYDLVSNCKTMCGTSQKAVVETPDSMTFLRKSVLQNNQRL